MRTVLLLCVMIAVVVAGTFCTGTAKAVTLSATTNLNGGALIPTNVGNFDDTGGAATPGPYVYYIDDTPDTPEASTLVAFDMGAFNLNNTGMSTEGITIHAASLSYGTGGGNFNMSGSNARPKLTVNVTGALLASSVNTSNTGTTNNGGAVTLSAYDGITLSSGINTSAMSYKYGGPIILDGDLDGNKIGAVTIGGFIDGSGTQGAVTISGSSIAINGSNNVGGNSISIVSHAKASTGGGEKSANITLTATNGGVTLAGGIWNNACGTAKANPIQVTSTGNISIRGPVSNDAGLTATGTNTASIGFTSSGGSVTINGPISANITTGTDGNLTISALTGGITLGAFDPTLLGNVTLLASTSGGVEIDKLLNVSSYLSDGNFTAFFNVSSDVLYNPRNSDPALAGLTYRIIERNGDPGDWRLMPIPEPGTLTLIGMALLGLGFYAWRRSRR